MKIFTAVLILGIAAVVWVSTADLGKFNAETSRARVVGETPAKSETERNAGEIAIYAQGREIADILSHLNALFAAKGIGFGLTSVEREADVSVHFQDDIGDSNAVGMTYPLLGQIYIANSVPADQVYVVLVHEFLHCAGVGHEPNDPSSVMYTSSQRQGQVKADHISKLRDLAGMNLLGRMGAQLGLTLGAIRCRQAESGEWSCSRFEGQRREPETQPAYGAEMPESPRDAFAECLRSRANCESEREAYYQSLAIPRRN